MTLTVVLLQLLLSEIFALATGSRPRRWAFTLGSTRVHQPATRLESETAQAVFARTS